MNAGEDKNVYYPPTSAELSIPVPISLNPGSANGIDIKLQEGVTIHYIMIY